MLRVGCARMSSIYSFVADTDERAHLSEEWKLWKNTGGITGTIRDHLSGKAHGTAWRETVTAQKLKGWEKLQDHDAAPNATASPKGARDGPFDIKIFYELLLRWIVVDDQVIHMFLFFLHDAYARCRL